MVNQILFNQVTEVELNKIQKANELLHKNNYPTIKSVTPVTVESILSLWNSFESGKDIFNIYIGGVTRDNLRLLKLEGVGQKDDNLLCICSSFKDIWLSKEKIYSIGASVTGFVIANRFGLSEHFLNHNSEAFANSADFFIEFEDIIDGQYSNFFTSTEEAKSQLLNYLFNS